ncbi:hypothetical protein CROQUDRAFT_650978 [Cronartium quercuum f. sp. fusiforme G11]|uniref:non-specific serine/threonine protein kinase n=1 Tax=Cronartium quercuum f. sp. fusiforme G11 TaxID=708437 RepID=A0A9P6TH04_9BASI|nr:hypothetical protein CROQUDRAFT_650978 [Cronartium quercuum f. sp. fusiforme G11]
MNSSDNHPSRSSKRSSASSHPIAGLTIPPFNPSNKRSQQTNPHPNHNRQRPVTTAITPQSRPNPPPDMPVPAAPSSRNRASHHVQTSNTVPHTPDEVLSPNTALNMVGPSHPMPRQRVYFGPYLLLQTLGEGEFGKVKLGVHSSPERWGEEVAIKLIKRGNVDTQARMIKVAREIDVLKLVKHPNIVRLYDVIETEKYIGIVLEYASGGELFDHILAHRYLKEKDASQLFAQLISGVTYLHNKKIVHRDLKLENLLLDRNRNIIITDFGFANRFEDRTSDLMATSCGSPCYAAPELVVQDGRYVGSQVDVWSCGVILYAMLAGYLPFDDDPSNPDGDNINLLYKYIINTPLSFPEWITDQPKDLLLRMLVPDPLKRCALSDVIRHPWLAKYSHLFERSIEELELISEANEQQKRTALQQQRQAIAAAAAGGGAAGDQIGRSQTAANASGISGRARAHQSAMVVPTTTTMGEDEQYTTQGAGAYQQQRQQSTAAGLVTHLTSSPQNPPTGIPVPKNTRRAQQVQSAMVVPSSSTRQNKENEVLVGMGEVYSAIAADQVEADETMVIGGKKRKAGGAANGAGGAPASNQQRYTVQVEYSAAPGGDRKEDGRGKGKGVERADDEAMTDGAGMREDEMVHTPKMSQRMHMNGTDPMPGTPTGREAWEQQTTPQPNRTRHGSASTNPVINVTHPTGKQRGPELEEQDMDEVGYVPFPTPPISSKGPIGEQTNQINKHSAKLNQSTASIATGSHLSAGNNLVDTTMSHAHPKPESTTSKKESRHRKGMSTDRFFSRLLGNSQSNATPPLPHTAPAKKPPIAGINPSKSTRRKALSLVVEPISSKIPGTSAANRAQHRKTTRVVPSTPVTEASGAGRRTKGGSVMVSPSSGASVSNVSEGTRVRSPRRTTITATNKDGRADSSQEPDPSASAVIVGGGVDREQTEEETRREHVTGSPNWSHHTSATTSANSTSQMSSNSKAKRVMDWFRFKSLNTSSASTNTAQLNSNPPDGLIPPTPFTTDFDERRKRRESKGPVQAVPKPVSTSSSSTRGPANGDETATLDPPAMAHTRSAQPELQSVNDAAPTSAPAVPFNDSKLKLHHGAIDQNAISSISPPLIMTQLKKILWELGMDVTEENAMKLKAMRRSKKKVVASLGLGVFEALQQQQAGSSSTTGLAPSPAGFRSIFQRKVSSTSVVGPGGVMIDQFGNVQAEASLGSGGQQQQQPLPAYADDPSVDSGDDVRFTVEITRLRGLSGLYAVDIKRLKGSLWSFKYLYLQILERAELGKQQQRA